MTAAALPHLAWLTWPPDGPDLAHASEPEDVTGAYQWPAGAALAAELAAVVDCRGRRVVDLGCGRGALGFTAIGLGAAQVLFTDASAIALDYVARVIATNRLTNAAIMQQSWGKPLADRHDLILGGDILYRPECFAELFTTIAASLAEDGVCLLADPRRQLDEELPRLASAHRLTWISEHRTGGTVVRVSPRSV